VLPLAELTVPDPRDLDREYPSASP
jgi:hypothetical protein